MLSHEVGKAIRTIEEESLSPAARRRQLFPSDCGHEKSTAQSLHSTLSSSYVGSWEEQKGHTQILETQSSLHGLL